MDFAPQKFWLCFGRMLRAGQTLFSAQMLSAKGLLCVAAVLGIAGSARAEILDEAYFPAHIGDERISDVVFISPLGTVEHSTLTVTVKEKAERDGKAYFRVRFFMEGAYPQDYTKLTRKDAEGVYSIDERNPAAKEEMEISLPLKKGDTQFLGSGEAKMKVTVITREAVSAGEKSYEQCYHLRMVPPGGASTREMWLAPDIGPVKSVTLFTNNGKMSVTLRQFTAGAR